jgi:hypothetical protein
VNNDDFDKKFSLAKTLTNIRNSSNATTDSSNAQLMNADRCKGIAEASGFADVLSCKKSSIRLRYLHCFLNN